ncbi:SAM-dependent methyltransferase [Amycolatopsis aidingensis]|uniref:SAM-dependent methyltransferase n=1 Tax=Amycolatopsis aidingensis TaxID=2842453 RepID=UPI001C0BC080|nr:SAM-dependent methyltransferase [Amycolatopsis aidingensis]
MAERDADSFPLPGLDLDHPSVARVYDYFLGGETNWTIDRRFGDQVLTAFPLVRPIAKANRLFLHKAVRHLIRKGVRQFVDIGSGLPTMGHTHQVADELAPGQAHVAYVDHEPIAVAHSRKLLQEHGDPRRHTVLQADMRDPDRLWNQLADSEVIDLDQPIALLLIAVLHIRQPGADGTELGPVAVARYRELLPPGSYLAISHVTTDGIPADFADKLADLKRRYDSAGNPVIWRTEAEITGLFGDLTLLDPGVTWTTLWHPEDLGGTAPVITFDRPNESIVLAGVARKPE